MSCGGRLIVSRVVGLRQHAHQQRGVGDAARHRPGAAAGVGRVDRNPAEARLQGEDAAPGRRQAQRPADVGADVQRPVAGRDRRARAGAAAARLLAQVPGVARQRMEARQARGQHPVVGHRRLAEDHRARLAHPRRRRRVARRRHEQARRGAHRHRRAAGGDVLLDRRRHAVDRRRAARPSRQRASRGARRRERRLGIERIGRLQVRLPGGDARQHRLGRLDRRELAPPVERDQLGRAELVQGVSASAHCQLSAARSLPKIGELLHMPFSRLLPTANCGSWNR